MNETLQNATAASVRTLLLRNREVFLGVMNDNRIIDAIKAWKHEGRVLISGYYNNHRPGLLFGGQSELDEMIWEYTDCGYLVTYSPSMQAELADYHEKARRAAVL